MLEKKEKKIRRHKRIRAKIYGTSKRPRRCVFTSKKHIYAQLINDEKGKTLLIASDQEIKKPTILTQPTPHTQQQKSKVDIAKEVGKLIAKKTLEKKIEKVVFDRGGYQYHGKVKALAEGAREGGLIF